MSINYDAWCVDLSHGTATHELGLSIQFSGSPDSSEFEGALSNMPCDLTNLEKVRLIRYGYESYRKAWAEAVRRTA